jgi:hypothetical protein|tara:strand:+ start:460 stop:672 length:213 start_codon:yes stop_codon:yes gene_type:complete
MIKIEGNTNLVRDENTLAVINTDSQGLIRAKLLKTRISSQDNEINTLKEEVNSIKDLLLQINERLKCQEQ